ncbi:hypothetical protein Tco_1135039 [Tanacetum coccineum]
MGSRIRLFIKGKKHGRMMLDSIDNGPLVYPTIEEDGQTRLKKYSELTEAQQLQDDYSGLTVPTFQQGEDLIDCINKAMEFLYDVASRFSPLNNKLKPSSNPRNQATIQDGRVTCTQPKRPRSFAWFKEKLMLAEAQEASQILDEEQLAFIAAPGIAEVQVAQQTIPQNSAFQTEDLDAYDSDCDDISWAVLMENLSSCDSNVLSKEHDVISVIDDEETLILEEESRSKMLGKQNDPISIKQKINISPIDYSTIEAPSELPKVSLVNEILKKLKYQLASFDKVMKKRTTYDDITVDKNAFEIQIKQLSIDNDQLLKQIMSQEIVRIAVNSIDILNVNMSCVDECNKCLELETELLKKKDLIEKDVYNKLLKSYSTLKKHCIF